MKFLVTGATGFVGTHLVHKLITEGHFVVVLSRNIQNAKNKLPAGVAVHFWNPIGEQPPTEAFDGIDAVIHLAGEGIAEKRWSPKQKEEILESRVLGTRYLVNKINSLAEKPKVFVSTSAIGIYADRGDEELTEDSNTPEVDFLSKVCLDWETEAKKIDPSVRLCIVRVGIVLGKDGGAIKKMLLPFKLGLGGRLGSGNHWMSWIHVEDLAKMYLFCAENENAKGIFHGTAPSPVINKEFTKSLGKVIKRPTIFPAPGFALKIMLGEVSTVLLSSSKCLPKKAKDLGFRFDYNGLEHALTNVLRE